VARRPIVGASGERCAGGNLWTPVGNPRSRLERLAQSRPKPPWRFDRRSSSRSREVLGLDRLDPGIACNASCGGAILKALGQDLEPLPILGMGASSRATGLDQRRARRRRPGLGGDHLRGHHANPRSAPAAGGQRISGFRLWITPVPPRGACASLSATGSPAAEID
jgi:hypothetical protein